MSTKYKHSHEVPTAVLAKRLDELSDAVGKRGEERDRELTRRLPAELDRDADLVLLEASTRLLKMEAEVARLKRQVCEVAGEADWADHVAETSREELEEVGEENYGLKRERDALAARVTALETENAVMDQERSHYRLEVMKLAAHVEAIAAAIDDIDPDRGVSLAVDIIDQCPTTSLARRDAEIAQEIVAALTEAADRNHLRGAPSAENAIEFLLSLARQEYERRRPLQLRRQAEENVS